MNNKDERSKIMKGRSYCYKCKKKKERKYMHQVAIAKNNRMRWQCVDCTDENRMFGHNRRHGNDYSKIVKGNTPLDRYRVLRPGRKGTG